MRDGSAVRDYADDVEARWDDDGTIWRVPSVSCKEWQQKEKDKEKHKCKGKKGESF